MTYHLDLQSTTSDVGVYRSMATDEPSLARKGAASKDGVNSSAAIIDSQSVKTTEVAQAVGYDGAKLVKGHKRHIRR